MNEKTSISSHLNLLEQCLKQDEQARSVLVLLQKNWAELKKRNTAILPDITKTLNALNQWLKESTPSSEVKKILAEVTTSLEEKVSSQQTFLKFSSNEIKNSVTNILDALRKINTQCTQSYSILSPLETFFHQQYAPNHEVRSDAISYCFELTQKLNQFISLKHLQEQALSETKMSVVMGIKPHSVERQQQFITVIDHFTLDEKNKWLQQMEHLSRTEAQSSLHKMFYAKEIKPLKLKHLAHTLQKKIEDLSHDLAGDSKAFVIELMKASPHELTMMRDKAYGLYVINETKKELNSLNLPKGNFLHQLLERLKEFLGFHTSRKHIINTASECQKMLSSLNPIEQQSIIQELDNIPEELNRASILVQEYKNILSKYKDSETPPNPQNIKTPNKN